jgi:hypothetical protein
MTLRRAAIRRRKAFSGHPLRRRVGDGVAAGAAPPGRRRRRRRRCCRQLAAAAAAGGGAGGGGGWRHLNVGILRRRATTLNAQH